MKTLRLIVAAIVALLSVLFLMPAIASADTLDCNSTITDATSDRVLDVNKVQSAVNSFVTEHPGADVYVRAFQNTPGGNTDAFWKQGLQQCSNWSNPTSNEPKSNIIMVVFGLDRKSALFYGGNYSTLSSSIDTIRGNDMNANLRSAQYTTAVTASLASMSSVLNGRSVGSGNNAKEVDGGTILTVLLWIFGVIAVIGAIIGIGYGIYRYADARVARREAEEERQKAQAKARDAKKAASIQITNAKTDQELRNQFLITTGGLPAVMVTEHQKAFNSIDHSCDEQIEMFSNLGQDPTTDIDVVLTQEAYEQLEQQYQTIANKLAAAAMAFEQLFANIEQDKSALTPEARAARWTGVNDCVNHLVAQVDTCGQTFDVTPVREKLSKLQQQIDSAHEHLDNTEKATDSYNELGKLESIADNLSDEVRQLMADRARITEARLTIAEEISAHRKRLQNLTHVSGDRAIANLSKVESSLQGFITANLTPNHSRSDQIKAIDDFVNRVTKTGQDDIAKDDQIEAKKRREAEEHARREREAREEEERKRRRKREKEEEDRRQRNSYNTTIISSSSYNSSSSSSSWSSSDYGGSSGSWSGGGDSGGSSGSW